MVKEKISSPHQYASKSSVSPSNLPTPAAIINEWYLMGDVDWSKWLVFEEVSYGKHLYGE